MDTKIDKKGVGFGSGVFCRLLRGQMEEGGSSLERVDCSEEFVSDRSSLLSLQPWIFRKESSQDGEESIGVNGHYGLDRFTGGSPDELSPRNVRLGFGRRSGRTSLRNKRSHRYAVKPAVSMGDCLIPQLFNEDFEIGGSGFDSVPSAAMPTARPLIITDGSRIISRSIHNSLGTTFENGLQKEVDEVSLGPMGVVGVPSLPPLRHLKHNGREAQHPELDTSNIQRASEISLSQDSPGRMLLLCLGINIGVISTIISNRREVERLNDKLRHTEKLVQDLQEKLEMKESLTVNELSNEACHNQEVNGSYANMSLDPLQTHGVPSFPSEEIDEYDCLHSSKSRGNSELSKIEAELEAELERLELNMNATSLEGRISGLGKLDPDFIGDTVHGELKVDLLNEGARGGQVDTNRDGSGTPTKTNNPNYAVSPTELSLRLHEVIQFRLEERVKELESAVQCSQRQVESTEDERAISQSQRSFSNSEKWPSPGEESPTLTSKDRDSATPLCLNLSGNALNAFDEAYEEFMRYPDNVDCVPSPTNTNKEVKDDGLLQSYGNQTCGKECSGEGKTFIDTSCFRTEEWWEQMLSRSYSDDDESNDTDDEEGKLLIQQIVERTKQGSSVLIHAQRMLFAMED